MVPEKYLKVLRRIYTALGQEVSWAVTGSLGFALQGVPVQVNDIDLQTDEAGAYEIERRFSEFVQRKVRFSSASAVRPHFGSLLLDGIVVEIMGALEKRLPDGTWEGPVDIDLYKRTVQVEDMRIPVLDLKYEYEAYLKLGRISRAKLLLGWLRKHPEYHIRGSER